MCIESVTTLPPMEPFTIRMHITQFSCTHSGACPVGMEIAFGDDYEGSVRRFLADPNISRSEVRNFTSMADAVDHLIEKELVGKPSSIITKVGIGEIMFDAEGAYDSLETYGSSRHTRIILLLPNEHSPSPRTVETGWTEGNPWLVKFAEIVDYIRNATESSNYDPVDDAYDYIATERDRYSPWLW